MVQRSTLSEAEVLCNSGKRSVQIVSVTSAPDARATLTRVTLQPGAVSPRHSHSASEQIWIVEQGEARLLLANGSEIMAPGDVVRTPPGEIHGIENTGTVPFVYLTVTCPPEDMTRYYGPDASPASA